MHCSVVIAKAGPSVPYQTVLLFFLISFQRTTATITHACLPIHGTHTHTPFAVQCECVYVGQTQRNTTHVFVYRLSHIRQILIACMGWAHSSDHSMKSQFSQPSHTGIPWQSHWNWYVLTQTFAYLLADRNENTHTHKKKTKNCLSVISCSFIAFAPPHGRALRHMQLHVYVQASLCLDQTILSTPPRLPFSHQSACACMSDFVYLCVCVCLCVCVRAQDCVCVVCRTGNGE